MTEDQKIDAAIALLIERGMRESRAYPIGLNALRKLGWTVKPPAFSPFKNLVFGFGAYFAAIWGMLMHFTPLGKNFGWPLLPIALVAGLLFGLSMAWLIKKRVNDLNLPAWEDIGKPE